MKKFFSLFSALLFAGSMMAVDVTYSQTSTSAASVSSGTAPEGSSVTFANTYTNNKEQITSGNTMTLTLSGYDGYEITGVSVSVHNNKSSGNGSGTLTINGVEKGSLTGITGLGNTDWTVKDFTVTSTKVATDGKVVIVLSCSANSVFCNAFTITYSSPAAVATPTISPDETSFENSVEVSMACSTDGATIRYTLDGTAPTTTSTEYTGAFTLTDTTTVKAKAFKGDDESLVISKTFTKFGPLTCAEFAARANGVSALLDEVTVTYVSGKYIYVKDDSGVILLYDKNDKNLGLAAGDAVTGIKGEVSIYNKLHEVVPTVGASALTINHGEAPDPIAFSVAPTSADVNKYIVLNDVTVAAGAFESDKSYTVLSLTKDETTIELRNTFGKDFTFVAGTHYNVVATVAINNNTLQLYFISAEEKVCSKVVTITKGAETNGSYDLSAEQICGEGDGDDITVSNIIPAAGYEFDEITTSASGTVDNANKKVIGITANTTITVKFKAIPKYTVSFSTGSGNPSVDDITETLGGQGITLPAGVTPARADWTFTGWAESAIDEQTTVKPTILNAGDKYIPDSNTTLYAIYSKTTGASAVSGNTTINATIAGVTGSYGDGTDKGDYKWSYTQLMLNSGCMQGNNSKSSILWNTVVFPAAISKIELEVGKTAGPDNTAALCFGSSAKPEDEDIALGKGTDYSLTTVGTLTITEGIPANSTYMSLLWTSGASYYSSVKVYWGDAGITYYTSSPSDTPTALDNTLSAPKAVKTIVNGQLLITRDGKTYNVLGTAVK